MITDEWLLLKEKITSESGSQVLKFYDSVHLSITELCKINCLDQFCISAAMVLFHKFIITDTKIEMENIEQVYIACLFLATKVCNKLISIVKLTKSYLLIKKVDESKLKEFTEKVLSFELQILTLIGFDLNIDLPYMYVEKMRPYFKDHIGKDSIVQAIYRFINDSFIVPVALFYSPLKIALAAVYLLNLHMKINLPDKENLKWYHFLNAEIDVEEIKEIADLIGVIYAKKNKEKPDVCAAYKGLIDFYLGRKRQKDVENIANSDDDCLFPMNKCSEKSNLEVTIKELS